MSTRARRALIACAATLLLGAGAIFGAGEYLSAPVHHAAGDPPAELFATPVLIPNGKGYVAGWVARGAGSGAVLLLHGVRAHRRQMLARAEFLNRAGYTVLLIDLPAHGESAGKRITFGAHEAEGVRVALDWLRRNLPGEKIGVIGASLGAASVVLLEPGNKIDALVVEAMYPTIEEAVANRLSMRLGPPGAWLAPLLTQQIPLRSGVRISALRPVDAIRKLACPVLVIGGALDRHTTAEETRRVHAAAPEAKQLWMVDGAAHVDLHAFNPLEYERRVREFLEMHLRR